MLPGVVENLTVIDQTHANNTRCQVGPVVRDRRSSRADRGQGRAGRASDCQRIVCCGSHLPSCQSGAKVNNTIVLNVDNGEKPSSERYDTQWALRGADVVEAKSREGAKVASIKQSPGARAKKVCFVLRMS